MVSSVERFRLFENRDANFEDVHPLNDDLGEPGVRFDVLEVDVEVIGGVAKAIGPQVGRQVLAGLLRDVDADGAADRFDILRAR